MEHFGIIRNQSLYTTSTLHKKYCYSIIFLRKNVASVVSKLASQPLLLSNENALWDLLLDGRKYRHFFTNKN